MARIPKYRKQHSRNFAFVEYAGKRIRLPGDYGSTKSRQAYADFLARIADDQGDRVAAIQDTVDSISVGRLCYLFLLHAKRRYKNGSGEYDHFRVAVNQVGAADLLETPACLFGPRRLRLVRETMQPLGWSRQYINTQVKRVRRIFSWGVSEELVKPGILVALKSVPPLKRGEISAPEANPILPIDVAHVDATLPYTTPVVAAMVRLQLHSGMRPQNICGLTPGEVDRSGDVWLYVPAKHKTAHRGRVLNIYLGPKAQAVLSPYLDRPDDVYCFSPIESEQWRQDRRHVNRVHVRRPKQKGKGRVKRPLRDRYDTNSYRMAIVYAVRKANSHREKAAKMAGEDPPPSMPYISRTIVA